MIRNITTTNVQCLLLMFRINLLRYITVMLCDSIDRLCAPKPSTRQQDKKYFGLWQLMQLKVEKTFGHILLSALHSFGLISSDITLPSFGKPVNVSLTNAKIVRKFHTSDACVNPKSPGDPSDRRLIIVLQQQEKQPSNPEYLDFLRIRKIFFSDD